MSSFSKTFSGGFFINPNKLFDLLEDGTLDKNQYIILAYVMSLNNFRFHKTSRTQIATKLRIKRETVAECLNYLLYLGYIEIEPRGLYIIIHSNIVYNGNIQIKSQAKQKEQVDNIMEHPDISDEKQPDPIRGVLPAPIRGVLPDPNRGTIEVRLERRLEVVTECCGEAKNTTTISKDILRKIAKKFKVSIEDASKGYEHYCLSNPDKPTPFKILLSKVYPVSEFKDLIIDADNYKIKKEEADIEAQYVENRKREREERERLDQEEFLRLNAHKYNNSKVEA